MRNPRPFNAYMANHNIRKRLIDKLWVTTDLELSAAIRRAIKVADSLND